MGDPLAALACYQRAVELKPDFADAHNNLGLLNHDQGRLIEAIACYRRTLQINPDYSAAYNNLGLVLEEQKNFDEALACYQRAAQLNPNDANVFNNLGNIYQRNGQYETAIVNYRESLRLTPNLAQAHNNLANALQEQGQLDEAAESYQRALELNPEYAEAHTNHSLLRLLKGDFERGFPEYEWRWRRQETPPRQLREPLWDGSDLTGKTILLHPEQGLGDTLQFVRYIPLVKACGATVILECQKPLMKLLAGFPVDHLIPQRSELPRFDVHAPLLSLPGLLGTTLDSIPTEVPYLFPAPQLVEQWRQRLVELPGFRIGICWQGNPQYPGDRSRSIPLKYFAAVARVPEVRLISLQKGAGTEQIAEVAGEVPVVDWSSELDQQSGPFMDTAAVMKNLDLMITSDTSTAHLAGALGIPVWVALRLVPDWRWLLDRSDSPWYPTMQLFRQRRRDNWQEVLEEMAAALAERVQASTVSGMK